ncbi:hypothetical protein AA313_de0205789 [Arthrobotrys entomopaga]|nr:hypothetical protein AA313_de0205789 [Arthrobotrys entomopaga]
MATVLVPADSLRAVYEVVIVEGCPSPKLVLNASGQVSTGIRGIHFERVPILGGLRYKLVGYPILKPLAQNTPPTRSYTASSSFSMVLPNVVTPTGKVTIITENHPDGQTIDIENVQPLTTAPDTLSHVSNQTVISGRREETGDPISVLGPVLPPAKVRALVKETFEISIPDQVVTDISDIDIEYDPSFFVLVNAGHKTSDLFWELKPLVTGYSNIAIRTSRGGQNWWNLKTFNVRSFLPFGPAIPPSLSGTLTATNQDPKKAIDGVGFIQPFLDFIYTGIEIAKRVIPSAEMWEASMTSSTHQPVDDVADLNSLQMVFNVGKGQTGYLTSTGWGDWSPLTTVHQPFFGDIVIKPPIAMDAKEAQDLKDASYPGSFYGFILRHPVYRGDVEPYYIFTMGNFRYIFVGVNTKTVFEEYQSAAPGPSHES